MSAHPHAALMAEYAKDAAETDKPWEWWEVCDGPGYAWCSLDLHPAWSEDRVYRRKPRTIRIGKFDVPEPMREVVEGGATYWVPNITTTGSNLASGPMTWDYEASDRLWLRRGLCHATREAAELHARALISLTAEGGE